MGKRKTLKGVVVSDKMDKTIVVTVHKYFDSIEQHARR